jgi:hypothetical protein
MESEGKLQYLQQPATGIYTVPTEQIRCPLALIPYDSIYQWDAVRVVSNFQCHMNITRADIHPYAHPIQHALEN